jgi:S-formylglutathione hydrolase FrmB
VVESVILPAHAQTTGPVTSGTVITGTSAGGTGAITFP